MQSREIRLKIRPTGPATADNFELATVTLPAPAAGEVQVKNLWMTVDPFMRSMMKGIPGHPRSFEVGEAMKAEAVGEVTASADPAFKVGDLVLSNLGWREGFTAPAADVEKLDPRGLPIQSFLGAAGMTGLTAYLGLIKVIQPRPGDVIFVSGAAGAVGSMVCQMAKALGHKVIGSAGGPDKVAYLKEIGVDHAIDYKAEPDLVKAILAGSPEGIDAYFDNVGGPHLQAALATAKMNARIAICGSISTYNATEPVPGPTNLNMLISRCIRMEGFTVFAHGDKRAEFLDVLSAWVKDGKITWRETVLEGVDKAPEAFLGLFTGANVGKMLVKLA